MRFAGANGRSTGETRRVRREPGIVEAHGAASGQLPWLGDETCAVGDVPEGELDLLDDELTLLAEALESLQDRLPGVGPDDMHSQALNDRFGLVHEPFKAHAERAVGSSWARHASRSRSRSPRPEARSGKNGAQAMQAAQAASRAPVALRRVGPNGNNGLRHPAGPATAAAVAALAAPAPSPSPSPPRAAVAALPAPAPQRTSAASATSMSSRESKRRFEVREVESTEEKQACYKLHLSKNTFAEESEFVRIRIFEGDPWRCRSWVLLGPAPRIVPIAGASATASTAPARPPSPESTVGSQASSATGVTATGASTASGSGRGRGVRTRRGRNAGASATNGVAPVVPTVRELEEGDLTCSTGEDMAYLAAVTCRLNPYAQHDGFWAQILNVSVARERSGYGTWLMAGVEELLRREVVRVIALYPAQNGRAPAFWQSIGYGSSSSSELPSEELVPHQNGGPLMPEFDPSTLRQLPRWEKRLLPGGGGGGKDVPMLFKDGQPARGRARGRGRGGRGAKQTVQNERFRAVAAADSRLSGEVLQAASNALTDFRARLKAAAMGRPLGK